MVASLAYGFSLGGENVVIIKGQAYVYMKKKNSLMSQKEPENIITLIFSRSTYVTYITSVSSAFIIDLKIIIIEEVPLIKIFLMYCM
jgi:hypothetical protein